MGPLEGVRVIELAGRGPGPFAGMMLADMGADLLRVDRPGSGGRPQSPNPRLELVNRGRRSVTVDLKHPDGRDLMLDLVTGADVLFEGFRPGVVERLGVGPDQCLARNPALVYARATGWGQTGPLADVAGHDINYIALAGALEPIGLSDHPPIPPLNLVGDYGGGGAMLAFGIVCGLLEAQRSKRGQVIDAAMMDGASLLMTMIHGRREMGVWKETRGTNYLDGGAPFYSTYETLDGKYISIGSIEDEFYATFVAALGLEVSDLAPQWDRSSWPATKARIADIVRSRTRREWEERMGSRDVCFAPVLTLSEVADHPHHRERGSFIDVDGVIQPAPMPRFSRTSPKVSRPPALPGEHSREALLDWGIDMARVDRLIASEAVIEG